MLRLEHRHAHMLRQNSHADDEKDTKIQNDSKKTESLLKIQTEMLADLHECNVCFITGQYLKVMMMFAATAARVCKYAHICAKETEKVNMMLYVPSISVSEGSKRLIKEHQFAFRPQSTYIHAQCHWQLKL